MKDTISEHPPAPETLRDAPGPGLVAAQMEALLTGQGLTFERDENVYRAYVDGGFLTLEREGDAETAYIEWVGFLRAVSPSPPSTIFRTRESCEFLLASLFHFPARFGGYRTITG